VVSGRRATGPSGRTWASTEGRGPARRGQLVEGCQGALDSARRRTDIALEVDGRRTLR